MTQDDRMETITDPEQIRAVWEAGDMGEESLGGDSESGTYNRSNRPPAGPRPDVDNPWALLPDDHPKRPKQCGGCGTKWVDAETARACERRHGDDITTPAPVGAAVALDLDAAEPEPPNAVEVDESGCSCKIGPYRGFQRCPIDPACPKHGEPLRHGDGDVRVFHPDGSTSIIREPSEAEHLESLACAVASVTPCSCSAQRARAEAAEAEVVTLRAKVAAVEALVRDWPCSDDTCDGDCTGCAYASDLRAALATTGEGQ